MFATAGIHLAVAFGQARRSAHTPMAKQRKFAIVREWYLPDDGIGTLRYRFAAVPEPR
jgi:hypothetical protein